MAKTGLFVEGGGMKCAYSAGLLDAFLDEGIEFDYCMGVSAGAANVASYQAKQRERNLRYYTIHVKDPRYISMRSFVKTGNFFGLQFIYGDMTNEGGIDPLDYDVMMSNPAEMVFPATDAVTGEMRYFTKADCKRDDYRPIMATCALPVMCQPIELDGHFYYDGGVGDSIPIDKMLSDGCDRIIAIMSKPRGFVMKPEGHRAGYHFALQHKFPKTIELLDHRHENYNASMKKLLALQAKKQAMIFCPSPEIKIGTYTTDPKIMKAFYDNGMADAKKEMDAIKAFLAR